ncbi:Hypothetical protein POVR2_LOCUS23 [uncultured virus]|nr:Hypothetical protein POVR2_LOCUS23 [uncultured virus]
MLATRPYNNKGMAILVYYVQAASGEVGFVFVEGSQRTLYTYSAIDLLDWRSGKPGKIVKTNSIDLDHWTSTMQVLTTTTYSMMQYYAHIVSWSEKIGNYSLFEKLGATQKSFAVETLSFFSRLGEKSTSLSKLSIVCYYLEWRERTRMSMARMLEVDRQYDVLRSLAYSEDSLRDMIVELGNYYISGDQLSAITVRRETEYLTIEETIVPAAITVAASTVGIDYSVSCPNQPNVVPPTDNSGLLIVVFLFTILIVLLVIVVLILESNSERELIGANPIQSIPSVVPL